MDAALAAVRAGRSVGSPGTRSGRGRYHTGGYGQGRPGRYRGAREALGAKHSSASTPFAAAGMPTKTSTVSRMLTRDTVANGVDHQIAGCRSRHGRAASSCADSEISVVSSPVRPASIIPIGRPSAVQYSGTLTAGWPVTL